MLRPDIRQRIAYMKRWRLPPPFRVFVQMIGALLAGLAFAWLFCAVFAKDTASTYEAYVGPSLEAAGIPRREVTAAIETGAAHGVRALVVEYESLCRRDPARVVRRVDCGAVHKLNAERVPDEP